MADDLNDLIRTIPERIVGGTKTYSIEVPEGTTLKLETSPGGEEIFTASPDSDKKLVVQITVYVEEVAE